jgi:outer membrane receptor protein involved in Fe transport
MNMSWNAPRPASIRAFFIALLSLAANAALASDVRFAATLLLPDGQPATGYNVSVVGRPLSATCDAQGRFVLDPVPSPPFLLVATGPQGEVSGQIEITELTAEVRLPEVVRESITVVSGVAPSLETLPGNAATLIGIEEIEQRVPERLVNTLESVAGASKLGDGADAVPALRGLGKGRTLLLIDGARVTAERRAGPSATFVDPAGLSAVEILRGPGAVIYGSDAFGGVINAVTRDPDVDGPAVVVDADAGGGALDQYSAYAAVSFGSGNSHWLVSANTIDSNEAEAGDGVRIVNSEYAWQGAALRYVHDDVGGGRLRLAFSLDRGEDLGKSAIDTNANLAIYPAENSDRFTASWIGAVGETWDAVEARFFYGQYGIVLDRTRLPNPTTTRRVDRSDTESDDASLRLVAGRELGGGRFQVGFDSHSRFNLSSAVTRTSFNAADVQTTVVTTPSIDDAKQSTLGLFATWNKPLNDWASLGIGVRGDKIETENSGGFFGDRDDSQSPVSGNVALTIGPFANTTATLQYSQGFRTPSLSDRYFRGPSGRGFAIGNPDLHPEESQQIDLALRYGKGRTAVAFYAYEYQIDDLIERFAVGDNFNFRNRGEAEIRGAELEVQTSSGPWSGELGLAIADGEADGNDIDDISAPNAFLNVRRSFGSLYALGRVTTFREKDDPGPNELERPGFTLFDLGAGYRFNDRVELRAMVRNVGDKLYFAAPDNAADRAIGRSFSVGVSGRF